MIRKYQTLARCAGKFNFPAHETIELDDEAAKELLAADPPAIRLLEPEKPKAKESAQSSDKRTK